jgi:site-specific DNA-cytosine methylase
MDTRTIYLVDRKAHARKFHSLAHKGLYDHQYAYFTPVYEGPCLLHRAASSCVCEPVDCAIQGLPCQPFSPLRHTAGATVSTGDAASHPDTQTLVDVFAQYIAGPEKPKGFVVEEVLEFLTVRNKETGLTFVSELLAVCQEAGYSVEVVKLHANIWSETPRSRCFVIGLGPLLGGKKAARWVASKIEELGVTVRTIGSW